MVNAVRIVYLLCVLLILPVAVCIWRERRPEHFRKRQLLAGIVLYSALSWALTNGCIFLCYMIDSSSLRGPEAGVALFFGELYLWFTSLPVFLAWAAFRGFFPRRSGADS